MTQMTKKSRVSKWSKNIENLFIRLFGHFLMQGNISAYQVMIVKTKFIKEPERFEVFNFLNLYFSRKHLQLRESLSSRRPLQSGQSQTFF